VDAVERYVDGEGTEEQMAIARTASHRAFYDAYGAQYEAEAEAGFTYTADYCKVTARFAAACAARIAASSRVDLYLEALHAFETVELVETGTLRARFGCNRWAALAVADMALSNWLRTGGERANFKEWHRCRDETTD